MAVRIVTDSSSGLPEHIINELDITVIDLHVMSDDGEQSTSGLSALELAAAYARQLERGGDDGVVALHLSKELSATWSSAVAAAAVFDGAVRVVDSGEVGMSVGAAAMAAATVAREGADLDECERVAEDTLSRARTWIYLHQLDELRKSGRLSTTTAVLSAALLATKPIMHVRDGKLELAGKTRTQTKAFRKLVELVQESAGGQPAFVAVQHADAKEAAELLEDMLVDVLPEHSTVLITELNGVLRVHTGVGAIGLSAVVAAPGPVDKSAKK
ncbi:DegV family protein [Corynebacterium cystitidis]|uniref:EDD domain protein, DegV family n=1 Tax=Corynebacterium cystitidis DSM 20524 TaxID=1121357 RepID=A0A1H9SSX5_9CORY|nr:DegV family protein [Corynebacterium cystitidis]WJY83174.1 DegV domain-containing protein [Corynebacterium cystitidis DSM 20524]SER88056.1 EDD domain protein, DegV family [Corynebacterium cystitidis DSM 20524]SNV67102.1 DegV family protein [Corynebacterium cystitidis]